MRGLSRLRPFAAACLGIVASCGDSAPFVGYVSRSEFFEYHDQADEALCPSLLTLLDDHARTVGGEIGLTADPNRPFRYYKFRDRQAFYTTYEAGGKAFGDDLFSPDYFQAHEQAHVYTFRVWGGWSADWIDEGEAVALSCDPTEDPTPSTTPRALWNPSDWRSQLYDGLFNARGYAAAGVIITFLAHHYGWERVGRLHQRVPPGSSQVDLELAFAEVFPLSMDQAWSQALDTPGGPACDRTWICRSTALAVGEQLQPACDGRLYAAVTVPDGEDGVVLDLAEDRGLTLSGRCPNSSAPWYPLPGAANGAPATHWAFVPSGTYGLFGGASQEYVPAAGPAAVNDGEFTSVGPAPSAIGLRAYLPAGLAASVCQMAGTISLEPAAPTYIDLARGYDQAWIQIDGGGRSYGIDVVNVSGSGGNSPVELCDGCGSGASCTALPAAGATPAAGTVLHIQSAYVERPPAVGQIVFVPVARPL